MFPHPKSSSEVWLASFITLRFVNKIICSPFNSVVVVKKLFYAGRLKKNHSKKIGKKLTTMKGLKNVRNKLMLEKLRKK